MGKYPVITLCGSAKFRNDFLREQARLTLAGNIVLSLGMFDLPQGVTGSQMQMLKDIHRSKIDLSDEIFVINKNGCIGASTALEIEYAKSRHKKITYMESIG